MICPPPDVNSGSSLDIPRDVVQFLPIYGAAYLIQPPPADC